jgi:hypothetical protein
MFKNFDLNSLKRTRKSHFTFAIGITTELRAGNHIIDEVIFHNRRDECSVARNPWVHNQRGSSWRLRQKSNNMSKAGIEDFTPESGFLSGF